ncbi:MAG TPA: hypothetical protein VIL34_21475 [Actinopolymorphaceae bacterium]|jgi:hypothetical protein
MSSAVDLATQSRPEPRRIGTHVPGLGRVEWSVEQLTNHADLVSRTHVPDQSRKGFAARLLQGSPFRASRQPPACCVTCALDWPCPEVRWAAYWLSRRQRIRRAVVQPFRWPGE